MLPQPGQGTSTDHDVARRALLHWDVAGGTGVDLHQPGSGVHGHLLPEEAEECGHVWHSAGQGEQAYSGGGHLLHHDCVQDPIRASLRRHQGRVSITSACCFQES